MQAFSQLLLLLEDLLVLVEGVPSPQNLQPQVLQLLRDPGLSLFPLFNFVRLDRLIRPAVGGLPGHFSLQVLESRSDLVAFGLFLVQLVLQLYRHPVVSVLGLLQLDSRLVHLCQDVQILVLIHRGLPCLVQQHVVLLSQLLYLTLEHPVRVNQGVIGVLGLANGHLQLLFYLLVRAHLLLQLCVLDFLLLFLLVLLIVLILRVVLVLLLLFVLPNLLLPFPTPIE